MYYAKKRDLGECVDQNGSESFVKSIAEDGTVVVEFFVYDREFENGYSWEERHFRAVGKLKRYGDQKLFYSINKLEEIAVEEETVHELSAEEKQRVKEIEDLQKRNYEELVKLFPDIDLKGE